MSLLQLPNEILLIIADYLEYDCNINALSRTNRRLHRLLNTYLHQHNIRYFQSSALEWSARHGRASSVREMLDQGALLDVCVKEAWQPMALAAYHGHVDVVKVFLEKVVNPNSISGWRNPNARHSGTLGNPFSLALDRGHEPVLRLLVRHGAIPVHPTNKQVLPAAISAGHLSVVKFILEIDFNVDFLNNQSRTLLTSAAGAGHADIVQVLIDVGVRLNEDNNWGLIPLCWAARDNHMEAARTLLENGACPDHTPSNEGFLRAISCAVMAGHISMVNYLIDHFDVENRLEEAQDSQAMLMIIAISCKLTYLLRWILENGFPADSDMQVPMSTNYRYSLCWAVENGHLPSVELLLEYGADPNAMLYSRKPFSIAVRKGYREIVRLLLYKNDSPNAIVDGQPTIFYAVKHPNTLEILVNHGADPHTKGFMEKAIKDSKVSTVHKLLSLGVPIEIQRDSQNLYSGRMLMHRGVGMLELLALHGVLFDPASPHSNGHCDWQSPVVMSILCDTSSRCALLARRRCRSS